VAPVVNEQSSLAIHGNFGAHVFDMFGLHLVEDLGSGGCGCYAVHENVLGGELFRQ
jgi:hypothetical protein